MQSLGLVAAPGVMAQMPPDGHSESAVQEAPSLLPPTQRRPPQMGPAGPGGSGQSTLASHGSALALLQVLQKHRSAVNPGALHGGLAAESVAVAVAVVCEKSMSRSATVAPACGGQSRLVVPNVA